MDRNTQPAKLFIEPTTFCNLQCRMCVKQSRENGIAEGFLKWNRFEALEKIFPGLDAVVFSGIGEPLLHPQLDKMAAAVRARIPTASRIGLQTNGHLLDMERARALIKAGVDRICISMDGALEDTLERNRVGTEMVSVESALSAVNQARRTLSAERVELGIEYVLMRNNHAELPRAIEQAASRGADFAIATQMLPYDEQVVSEVLYTANTDASLKYFQKRQADALSRGLDLHAYFSVRWKYIKSDRDRELVDFVETMISDASDRQIPFHLRKLLAFDEKISSQVQAVFAQARESARQYGVQLQLPALYPKSERQCEFVRNKSVFLAWDGRIHPCYMLWHHYKCFFDGREKPIVARDFGQLPGQDILKIWESAPYAEFRQEVEDYEFPYCSNCNVGPCDLISNKGFEYDCFAMAVPCGDCPWCMGLMHCLQ